MNEHRILGADRIQSRSGIIDVVKSMKKDKIRLSQVEIGDEEMRYIEEALDANWMLPLGPDVKKFEAELKKFLSNTNNKEMQPKRLVALNSGTAAIHLALVLLGVGAEDEVICQSFSSAATANPICYQGAKPVFVDSERETWNMSPELLRQAIEGRIEATGKKPKAIIVVQLYGMPAKMDEIRAIAQEYKIALIEDAAEAIGSSYKGYPCGSMGDYGTFSFNGNMMSSSSYGGVLICPSEEQGARAMYFATQAREPAAHYQHTEIGYNYRMSNISAGIGRGQLLVLEHHIARRRANRAFYAAALAGKKGVTVMDKPSADFDSNFWLTCILIDPTKAGFDREELRLALEAEQIESRPLWKPMHMQPVFAECPFYGDGTSEKLFEEGLCLPSGSSLSEADLLRIASIVDSIV